jgi:hypothetical protein
LNERFAFVECRKIGIIEIIPSILTHSHVPEYFSTEVLKNLNKIADKHQKEKEEKKKHF